MPFRWPFVARSLLDRAELAHAETSALHAQREKELRADLLSERIRTANLTALVVRLKRDGAVLLPPQSTQGKPDRREPTAIEKAIDDNPRFRRAPGLAAHSLKWANEQIKAGVSEEDVTERLRAWGQADHDDDDDSEDMILG